VENAAWLQSADSGTSAFGMMGLESRPFSSRVMPTALRQKLGSVISYPNIAFQIALFTHVLGALVRLRITGYQIN
jgi:hypothetical protein